MRIAKQLLIVAVIFVAACYYIMVSTYNIVDGVEASDRFGRSFLATPEWLSDIGVSGWKGVGALLTDIAFYVGVGFTIFFISKFKGERV